MIKPGTRWRGRGGEGGSGGGALPLLTVEQKHGKNTAGLLYTPEDLLQFALSKERARQRIQEVPYPLVCKKFVDMPTQLAAKLYKRLLLGLVIEVVPVKTRRTGPLC